MHRFGSRLDVKAVVNAVNTDFMRTLLDQSDAKAVVNAVNVRLIRLCSRARLNELR